MKNTLNILDKINVDIEITENKFNFKFTDLFLMAARKNPKRAFLFVSKLLGKHIPINPKKAILTGRLLGILVGRAMGKSIDNNYSIMAKALKDTSLLENAFMFSEKNLISLKKPTVFIGFAETATALGNSVFSQFIGDDIYYIHTTRDEIKEFNSIFDFKEEHSHATSHFCYSLNENILSQAKRIVLIDDEITTGKTILNLIRAINKKYPIKEYVVASILDWRNKEFIKRYDDIKRELNIDIKVVSLFKGEVFCKSPSIDTIEIKYQNDYPNDIEGIFNEVYENGNIVSKSYEDKRGKDNVIIRNHFFKGEEMIGLSRILGDGNEKKYDYLKHSGRFGISTHDLYKIEMDIENIIKNMKIPKEKVLVLGTEEFMYIPMIMASLIPNAKYASTTRSPIYVGTKEEYAIKYAAKFKNPFDKQVENYIYNLGYEKYKSVFFVTEREIDNASKMEIIKLFYSAKIYNINFIYFSKN